MEEDNYYDIPTSINYPATTEDKDQFTVEQLAKGANRLRNPGFEKSTKPDGWARRCSDAMIHTKPNFAHEGTNFWGCSDRGSEGKGHPSIYQKLPIIEDGLYRHAFSIYIYTQSTPHERRVRLALWQLVNTEQPGPASWWCAAKSPYEIVSREWQKHSIVVDGGGGTWMCEVYWFDEYKGDIRFDAGYFNSMPLK